MRALLEADFQRFAAGLPREFPQYVRDAYRIDLTGRYLGRSIPHPIGKGSGQLSLREEQLEADGAAGLAFVVLKTVIAQDETGSQSMAAWAIHETRMAVEPIVSREGRTGWTVTWKGRGWDRSFEEYLALLRSGRDLTREGQLLVVPSVKYHLPPLGESFRSAEYAYTTQALVEASGDEPLLLEKDFSPTLAGDALAGEQKQVLRWIREVPGQIRGSTKGKVKLALKLMNTRFEDPFQVTMLEAAAGSGADAAIVFNRLFDAEKKVAFGGWDLSDRNLRVLRSARAKGSAGRSISLSGTGNICTGQVLLEYAQLGCESVQLHTFFQLPLGEYSATAGSRTSRALHSLVFHPQHGMVSGMLDLEAQGKLHRVGGELRFLDLAGEDE